jgi:trk system potassium uptake protein TrkA
LDERRSNMKTFIVIGLGRFGTAAAEMLYDMGHEVLVIDQDEEAVTHLADKSTHGAIGDARDIDVLRAVGAEDCDCAIVAMGEDLAASVLITMNLKDLGCPYIICKAQNERYMRALERVGANRVVIPEREMAVRMVRSLGSNSFLDYMELSGEYAIAEIEPPKSWLGKDLRTLNVRARFGVSVLSIIGKDSGKVHMSPGADDVVSQGDTVMLMGKHADLDRLQKL